MGRRFESFRGYCEKPNSCNTKELGFGVSCECEKVCEVAQIDMGDKALSGSATHAFSSVDSVKNDPRLSLIIEHWDVIPESIRQSVFLQLAQFSFEKWREKT